MESYEIQRAVGFAKEIVGGTEVATAHGNECLNCMPDVGDLTSQ